MLTNLPGLESHQISVTSCLTQSQCDVIAIARNHFTKPRMNNTLHRMLRFAWSHCLTQDPVIQERSC
jgi:hypothetical protein